MVKYLHVGNLIGSDTAEALAAHLAAFRPGKIELFGDRGYALVQVEESLLDRAIREGNHSLFHGRRITVSESLSGIPVEA